MCFTWLLIGRNLPALGRRLPLSHSRIFWDGWLLAIDDEPVRERPHLDWTLGQLPPQLLHDHFILQSRYGYLCGYVNSRQCRAVQLSVCEGFKMNTWVLTSLRST